MKDEEKERSKGTQFEECSITATSITVASIKKKNT